MLKVELNLLEPEIFYALKLKAQESMGTKDPDRIAQGLLEVALGILIQASPDVPALHERLHTLGSIYETIHDHIAQLHAAEHIAKNAAPNETEAKQPPLRKEQVN